MSYQIRYLKCWTSFADYIRVSENEDEKGRFIIRGGLAFGLVFKGAYLPPDANNALANATAYKSQLLFGTPLAFAHEAESKAPPLGVFIDESARTAALENRQGKQPQLSGLWYDWCHKNSSLRKSTTDAIKAYFQYAREHNLSLDYDESKIDEHEKAAGQYWGFDWKGKK